MRRWREDHDIIVYRTFLFRLSRKRYIWIVSSHDPEPSSSHPTNLCINVKPKRIPPLPNHLHHLCCRVTRKTPFDFIDDHVRLQADLGVDPSGDFAVPLGAVEGETEAGENVEVSQER